MELKDLSGFVLLIVLVGMLLGVGVLTLNKFADATYYTSRANETINGMNNLSDQTYEVIKGNFSATPDIVLQNQTGETLTTYTFVENTTDGNRAYLAPTFNNASTNGTFSDEVYILFNYKNFNTITKTTLDESSTEVGNISSNWIGLIITVMILALILVLVIGSFGAART